MEADRREMVKNHKKEESLRKPRFSSDAKIILALIEKHPRTFDELREASGLSRTRFYDALFFFLKTGKIKDISEPCLRKNGESDRKEMRKKGKYALYTYTDLEGAFIKLKEKFDQVTKGDLAYEAGIPVEDISDREAAKLSRKYELKIGLEAIPKMKNLTHAWE